MRIKQELKEVNLKIWEAEEHLRESEKKQTFDEAFIQNARFVYRLNDERARIKKVINYETDSNIIEEKSY